MDPRILALIIIVFVFFVSVFVFSGIYYTYNKNSGLEYERTYSYSLYFSFTIQSLVGLAEPSTINRQGLQVWIMVQSLISYLVSIGIVFVIVKVMYKNIDNNKLKNK